MLINNYNTYKFKINKEHYEWKEDINKTNEQIIKAFLNGQSYQKSYKRYIRQSDQQCNCRWKRRVSKS